MPPNIIDIIIEATGQLPNWLMSHIDIVLKATPSLGGIPPIVLFGGFLVLVMGWHLLHEKE